LYEQRAFFCVVGLISSNHYFLTTHTVIFKYDLDSIENQIEEELGQSLY